MPCAAPRQAPRRGIAGQFGPACITPWGPGSLRGQLSYSLKGALSAARARAQMHVLPSYDDGDQGFLNAFFAQVAPPPSPY